MTKILSQKVVGPIPDAPAAPPLLQARREAALQRMDIHQGLRILKKKVNVQNPQIIILNSQVTKNFDRSSFELFTKSFALRQKMLNFLQNLEYYMTFEVSGDCLSVCRQDLQ